MQTIYLAMADYGLEGSQVMRAFVRKEEAQALAESCGAYQYTRPELRSGQTVAIGGRAHRNWMSKVAVWEGEHPAGEWLGAETFHVSEVQLVP